MRWLLLILTGLLVSASCRGQEENPLQDKNMIQQLESLTEQQEVETEDDSYLQDLVEFKRHPINLNTTDEAELKQLKLISDLQIANLIAYRKLLGNLLSIYELQAVPTWDVETINRILPYIRVGAALSLTADFKKRLTEGEHSILFRAQQVLQKSQGFLRADSILNRYPGSPQRIFLRYKYTYRNLLQFGITGDKDAGEQFFRGGQSAGFDFYSFHVFARNLGIVKAVVLGDFTVNLGQGLIQWQSLAFRKSAEITAIKRQAEIIRPYSSAGEFNFFRGAAATFGRRNIEFTLFASLRKLDATLNYDALYASDYISSILTTGYHRTPTEVSKKNVIGQISYGGNITYRKGAFHLGINFISHRFSAPMQRDVQPYNQYSIQGKSWYNYSTDFSYTYRNVHLFGEAAVDKNKSKAFVGGILASLDQRTDFSLVYRNISKEYDALYGNAFTEATTPTNEKGLYTGISIKPIPVLRVSAYSDIFSFPWLRYRVDAPSKGTEYLLQVNYTPNKNVEVYSRYKNEHKGANLSGLDIATRPVYVRPKQNWRTQIAMDVNRQLSLVQRVELLWYDGAGSVGKQHGFLAFIDGRYKVAGRKLSVNGRLQYFETDSYDSRLYAYESDLLYSYSIPVFSGKGFRYYVNLNYALTRNMTGWLKWSQTISSDKTSIGSGLDAIDGNARSEIKFQLLYSF